MSNDANSAPLALRRNILIEWLPMSDGGEDRPHLERVLDFDIDTGEVIVIKLFDDHAFPFLRSCKELQHAYEGHAIKICTVDPFAKFALPEDVLKPKHRKWRDRVWEEMLPLLQQEDAEFMLNPLKRGPLVRQLSSTTKRKDKRGKILKLSIVTINRRLRVWWQTGRTKNAFIPNHSVCGAPGKRRIANTESIDDRHHKVGRRSALAISIGRGHTGTGIRVTEDVRRKFELGLNRFYLTLDKRTLRQTFNLTIEKFFADGYDIVNGDPVAILPPSDQLPTFHQFYHWYKHGRDDDDCEKEIRSREGNNAFELRSRQMLGNSRALGLAPGSLCQIDSTIPNIYLVSALDRTRIIGRPVLYNGVDVFCSALLGFCVLLEGPSWVGAMLAVENIYRNKVAFCAEYGIEITEDEWPCQGLPTAITADRGEFEGYAPEGLINAFGTTVHNIGPRRPDWNNLVERSFGISNEKVVKFTPGYVPPMGHVRGNPDYALDAVLTPDEFRKLLIVYALHYNRSFYLKNYRKDEYMVTKKVRPYPLELWKWGMENRGGLLTSPPQDTVRMNLLPRKQVSVTARGIHFEGDLYYMCETAERENWAVRARNRGQWRIEVAYDPRTTEQIYFPLDGGMKLEVCHRTEASLNLPALDCYDAVDYYALERAAYQASTSRELRSDAELLAAKEAIVGPATEKTRAALVAAGLLSKRSRRESIRANRAAEKEHEREKNAWHIGEQRPDDNAPTSPGDSGFSTESEPYVPAASRLKRIDQLLEEEWPKK